MRVLFHAQVQSPSGLAAGPAPDEALVRSTDTLMQLAASHAWSRQGALAAAAEQSLLQAVSSAEEGMAAAACMPHAWPMTSDNHGFNYPAEDTVSGIVANHQESLLSSGRSSPGSWLAAAPAASALSVLPPISEAPRLARVASSLVSMACSAAPPAVAELAADSAAAVLNRAPTGVLLCPQRYLLHILRSMAGCAQNILSMSRF